MSHKHKVKTHHWRGGVLKVVDYFFETLEDALAFVTRSKHKYHHIKVYDPQEQIIENIYDNPRNEDTYA